MVTTNDETEEVRMMRTMLARASAFRAGRIQFPQLVSELSVCIEGLADRAPEIADALRDPWRALEEINALALDEGMLSPLEEYQDNVHRALSRIVSCISEVLDSRQKSSTHQ